MDNKVFNVNGKENNLLADALNLAFLQNGRETEAVAWMVTKEHGIILFSTHTSLPPAAQRFMAPMDADQVSKEIISWLKSDQAKETNMTGAWDKDQDHDGHNTLGWRVYKEDWGHVNGMWQAICAVRPAYMWHGK